MSVVVETEYSRFDCDRAKALEWLMDALIADGALTYERHGDLHKVRIIERGHPEPVHTIPASEWLPVSSVGH